MMYFKSPLQCLAWLVPKLQAVVQVAGNNASFFFNLLPYIEQESLFKLGKDAARGTAIKGLNNPLDPTWSANNGVYTLPASVPLWIAGGLTNPWPNWANQANATSTNKWGLSSYSANFQVFGDKGAKFTGIIRWAFPYSYYWRTLCRCFPCYWDFPTRRRRPLGLWHPTCGY